eukprot:m.76291 g.76291  ORF g.76291 m.76291 type:complete len:52 (-) comp8107_c2_seq1:203-358(-)
MAHEAHRRFGSFNASSRIVCPSFFKTSSSGFYLRSDIRVLSTAVCLFVWYV